VKISEKKIHENQDLINLKKDIRAEEYGSKQKRNIDVHDLNLS